MPATLVDPSYAQLADLVGQQLSVDIDGGGTISLWLECVSTPVSFDGHSSYSIRLTGPAAAALGSGERVLHSSHGDFRLDLDPVGRDIRYLHYEAHRIEAATDIA